MKLLLLAIALLLLGIVERSLMLMIRPLTALSVRVLSLMASISLSVRGTTNYSVPSPSPSTRRTRRPKEAAPASISTETTRLQTDLPLQAVSSSQGTPESVLQPVTSS